MILALLFRGVFWAVFDIKSKAVLNTNINSKYRTSMLSTFSFLTELPYILLAPILGYGIDKYGYSITILVFTGLICLGLLVSHFKFRNLKHNND